MSLLEVDDVKEHDAIVPERPETEGKEAYFGSSRHSDLSDISLDDSRRSSSNSSVPGSISGISNYIGRLVTWKGLFQDSHRISAERIYVISNVAAFSSLFSLIGLILVAITLTLTTPATLLQTMNRSYLFMKELADGYHRGIDEIVENDGDANMKEAISQFVLTVNHFPWRKLRESINRQQFEMLFQTLANAPKTIVESQDTAWALCITFRRIFADHISTDYCMPSSRYPPSRVTVSYISKNESPNALMGCIGGEYIEKGLPDFVAQWNSPKSPFYESHHTNMGLSTRVFEKLCVTNGSNGFGISVTLINRNLIHRDEHWYFDMVSIAPIYQSYSPPITVFNPTQQLINYSLESCIPNIDNICEPLRGMINVDIKVLKVRFPMADGYSDFHQFTPDLLLSSDDETVFVASINSDLSLRQNRFANKRRIIMDTVNHVWRMQSEDRHVFKAAMNVPLELKSSWVLIEGVVPQETDVPPTIYIDTVQISAYNESLEWNGLYKRSTDVSKVGYFAQMDPEPNLIFLKTNENNAVNSRKHRFFKAKSPDNQWYIQSSTRETIATQECNNDHPSCMLAVPRNGWNVDGLTTQQLEFHMDETRLHSITLSCAVKNRPESAIFINLKRSFYIKGSDMYFRLSVPEHRHKNGMDFIYDLVTIDLTIYDTDKTIQYCDENRPYVVLPKWDGFVESLGGKVSGEFTFHFHYTDDCYNFKASISSVHKFNPYP